MAFIGLLVYSFDWREFINKNLTQMPVSYSRTEIVATTATKRPYRMTDIDDAKEHLANIRRTFGTLNIQLNADVTVAYKRDNCIFDLYDIHKVCHKCGSPLLVERKGNWSPEHGMRIHEKFKLSFIAQRQNWANASVNVGTALLNFSPDLHMPIMEYLEDNKRFLQNDLMQRKTYQLMKMVQELFNCTFATKILKDWGIRQNDSWTGLMKSIDSNEVEFSICPLRFTRERFHAVFYSPELHVERIRFLLRHPKGSHMRNIFFEPLTYHVWCCVLALIVITAFLLTIYMHAEYQLYWKVNMSEGGRPLAPNNEPQMDFAIFTTLETIFMQGPSPDQFRLNSIRLLLISVSVFAVLLMQYYGAYIVSSLLSEAPRSITNLPALYESNLEIGMENISYNFELFGTATNQVVRNIYKKRICRKGIPNVMSMEQGVQRIAQGGFALHASVNRAYRILADILDETEFCELQEITFNTPFSAGLAMSKATPYRKFITTAILKFRESSLLLYNDRQWEIPHIDCATKSKNDVVVDLQHFAPVLVFLAFAILTSIWVFIMELLLHKHNQRQIHVNFKNICNTMHKYLSNKQ
ncbi:glutamate receptor ionotropic, kainate glr-3 [Stomoxys calcitrans]|uniref:glutamate receptor ionotropic, kainate glr-3 n=1 Tax=Stomoxys calcitrans TaxID=35570 RepID=UPI0027E249B3|nr:glutamate receptor ionotropic, kainate glr-3 [Stomoxys calcitrans]